MGMPPDEAVAAPMAGNQQALSGLLQQPISQDPFENLSRGQRTMMGFAALKDAGLALQGKEGSAVQSVIDDITNRADMERKRQGTLARNQMMSSLVGNSAGGREAILQAMAHGLVDAPTGQALIAEELRKERSGLRPADVSNGGLSLDDQIAALQSQVGQYANLDQLDLYTQKLQGLTDQRDREEDVKEAKVEKSQKVSGQLTQARDAVATAKLALSAATGLSGDELDEQLAAGEIDPKSFALVRQSFVPDSQSFKDFQAHAAKLGSMMTFSNLSEILDRGVVLGTLSDADFAIIGNLTGVMDPVGMPQQTAQTILQAYNNLNKTIAAIEAEVASGDPFDALTQKYSKKQY